MMKNILNIPLRGLVGLSLLLLIVGCNRDPHFITDKAYREQVHKDFEARKDNLGIDSEFDTLKRAEREAMEFLYAYMPYSDLADYSQAFFLDQVRYAFEAKDSMPWGKTVPEDVFRHFVLVYRVNNENLDTARQYMFHVLKDRVKNLSMEEAALEVNHWCHEHVAYRASDGRTSAPLATLRTALGRCGEESTFTVTAMRAVGIPARQCYTPRWAHCDDNHAWVEVWVDGKWKFLGACEPDPQLNMGWFSIPSTRCMMVHSKAFGKYHGDEEVVKQTSLYSELNLLSHYAPTRRITITIMDKVGKPVANADVDFRLYNYAEYYPLSTQKTNAKGQACLTTGLGDLLIWATNGNDYAYDKIDVRKDSTMTLVLGAVKHPEFVEFTMIPPAPGEAKVTATEEETAKNAKRLAYEDSLRAAYLATFPTEKDYPDAKVWESIKKSEGNYAEIAKFINSHSGNDLIFDYLRSFSDKDMRDIEAATLEAHLTTPGDFDIAVFKKGLMPARISNEMVRPYRKELASFKGRTVEQIRRWTIDNISVDDTGNYFGCPISPVGVLKLKHANPHSRDIFFVAACRSALIPSYLDNATNEIFVYENNRWIKVTFNGSSPFSGQGSLTLTYHGKNPAKPIYWPHFTLQKLIDGKFVTFDFEDDPRMDRFPATLQVEPGTYCLSTGNRYPDGEVRSRMEFFTVGNGEKVTKEIVILPLRGRTDDLGTLDKNTEIFDDVVLSDYAEKTGFLYINLGDYKEPSKHLIQELLGLQKEMRAWGGMTYMVGPKKADMVSWKLVNTDIAYSKGNLEETLIKTLKPKLNLNGDYPLVVLVSPEGKILYYSEGYKIGVIEQVLKLKNK